MSGAYFRGIQRAGRIDRGDLAVAGCVDGRDMGSADPTVPNDSNFIFLSCHRELASNQHNMCEKEMLMKTTDRLREQIIPRPFPPSRSWHWIRSETAHGLL